ncbi:MAG TPA: HAD family phosphatase [Candidatus Hydrogenedentes bacterium]|jgi:beta-phosphoglucomutase-like phosphatase (HAD superfamily)|nr:HAD family phosphatase [Candidatus Hydrogenedentota bacterium]
MIDAYIFDMDGTLLDSEILWVEAIEKCLVDFGFPVSHEEAVEIVYGVSWRDIYEDLRRRFPGFSLGYQQFVSVVDPIFGTLRHTRDIRIHSSVELLQTLARDYPVCIVSGSNTAGVNDGIDMMGIRQDIRFFLASEDYSPGKPDPACFLMAAERLEVDPARCLVFEDSQVGVQAAKAAGMHCVALSRPGRPRQDVSLADWVLDDLAAFSVRDYCPAS